MVHSEVLWIVTPCRLKM